jgi:MFS family permease
MIGLLSAIVFVGMLVGSGSNGYLADKYGRKRMLAWALGINFVAGKCSQ